MAYRFYLMPVVSGLDARGNSGANVPKYASSFDGSWTAMGMGTEPTCLVRADVTNGAHTTIAGNSDVTAVPANLDSTLGANLAAVQTALEGLNIPAGWATSGQTYRQVLKIVAAIFQFHQHLQGLGFARLFQTGITLSTQFNQLSAGVRSNLLAAAERMNFDTSSLSGTSTLRAILKALADQWTSGIAGF